MNEPRLAVDEIQGNVLPGFATEHQHLVGLRFATAGELRAFLQAENHHVTALGALVDHRQRRRTCREAGDDRPAQPRTWLNLCLSAGGLRLLAGEERVDGDVWDTWFKLGMWEVAGSLGDGDISGWVLGRCELETPHVLAILGDDDEDRLADAAAHVRAAGGDVLYEERGSRLPGHKEHFGFRDGVSVPAVRGRVGAHEPLYRRRMDPDDPRAARFARPGQVLLWPGQAVFGYETQSPTDVLEPGPRSEGGAAWLENGSFLVFRRLRQHVDRFRQFAREVGEELSRSSGAEVTPEKVEAMLVGRWHNGTPLVLHPDAPGEPGERDNEFDYLGRNGGLGSDLDALRCPHIAHIRQVNPRDARTDRVGEAMALVLQPFRRGVPYTHDGDVGLLFLAYATGIRDRFEALSVGWMNRPDAPEPGRTGLDLLAGQSESPDTPRWGTFPIGAGRTVTVETATRWVEPTGGGFFFSPSLTVLRNLAAGRLW